MQRKVRVVCVGFDAHRVHPIRLAVTEARERFGVDVDLNVLEREEAADLGAVEAARLGGSADAVFVAALTEERFLPVARAMADAAPRFYPSAPNLFEISAMARVPGLALEDPGAAGVLALAARVCAEGGRPVPPVPGLIATVLPQVAHVLPGNPPELRRMGRVLQAMLNLSPGNAALAFAAVAHEADPGQFPDPGWPEIYPACGFWHPDLGIFARWEEFEAALGQLWQGRERSGRALVVVFSTQVTGGNDAHLRALVAELEGRGIQAVPWFGALDAAGAVDEVLRVPGIDVVVNASGFTLTGTHGQPNVAGDVELLARWGVPHLNAVPLLFQSVEGWKREPVGLFPMAVAMQVAVPEMEGALAPRVFAGRADGDDRMVATEQAERIAAHASRLIGLRNLPNREKRVAIVLFCVPPDAGAVGTAAYLDVFASLHALLRRLDEEGYTVDVPASPEELLQALVDDSAGGARTGVRVAERYPAWKYVTTAPGLDRVTRCWGDPPGDIDTDGRNFLIRGAVFGNVAVVIQPDNGGYSDPIGLLYRDDASPSHSFTACYDWVRNAFRADVVLHFGTHGALEFMPGKQAGLLATDFSDALIGDLPHVYYYCMNNPAEAAIARRRSASEIVSYLSPPVAEAGLYGALEAARAAAVALRDDLTNPARMADLREAAAAAGLDAVARPESADDDPGAYLEQVTRALDDLEKTLIPLGLHVLGRGIRAEEASGILAAACEYPLQGAAGPSLVEALSDSLGSERAAREAARSLAEAVCAGSGVPAAPAFAGLPDGLLERWYGALASRLELLDGAAELDGLVAALSGRYIRPSPGGDPVREPDALPTGRGLVALDPYRVPTAAAARAGERLAEDLLRTAAASSGRLPETVGVVLWGLETIKARGEAIAQALWMIGVRPEADAFGRMTRFRIVPLDELGRPRVDVVLTVSGIFRDLFLPATELLDRAFRAVAALDEPPELNFVRKHALELADTLGVDPSDAAARVFSQRAGRYGTGVNDLVLSSQWEGEEDLAKAFQHAMAFSYGERRASAAAPAVFGGLLRTVEATFQNIDSTEVSLADVDHYFEYLGGLTNAVRAARGSEPAVYVADTFRPGGRVRSLGEALWLETKSRLLNPKWREAMLAHGYSGVAQVAMRLDNTYGWAATTTAVDGRLLEDVAREYLLNDALRERMAAENPLAVKRMADRLVEAVERGLWDAQAELVDALRDVAGRLDDAVEGVVLHAG